jgi:tight adherence protein B
MTALSAAVIVILIGAGILVIIAGQRPVDPTAPGPRRSQLLDLLGLRASGAIGRRRRIAAAATGVAVLLAAVTGLWILVPLTPAAILGLPSLLRRSRANEEVQRLGDLESWIRGLSGTLVGGSVGLEQALRASLGSAPPSLRPALSGLVARLDAQQPIRGALTRWADEMDDYISDLVAACLILEAERREGAVTKALDELAETVAELTASRRQIEADRSGPRSTARWVTIFSIGTIGLLALTSSYASWYATGVGQITAIVLITAYAGCLLWMRKIASGTPIPRFLPATTGR